MIYIRSTDSYFVTAVSFSKEFPVFISFCSLFAVYFYQLDFGCLTITKYISDLDHKMLLVTICDTFSDSMTHLWQHPNAQTNHSAILVHISLIPRYPTDNFWLTIATTINMDLIFHVYKIFQWEIGMNCYTCFL